MAESTQSQHVAASRALSMPEIIAAIIDAIPYNPRHVYYHTLYACALINSTWELEARRRIWGICGWSLGTKRIPSLIHLLLITDVSRRQDCANQIKVLHLSDRLQGLLYYLPYDVSWEGVYLSEMHYFSFSRLEEIRLEYPAHPDTEIPNPLPYEQLFGPRLRVLRIHGRRGRHECINLPHLFDTLEHRSKGLKELTIDWQPDIDDNTLSLDWSALLQKFLTSHPLLEQFHFNLPIDLSRRVFRLLVQSDSLRSLGIHENYHLTVRHFSPEESSESFRLLEQLDCTIDAEAVPKLLPRLQYLQWLKLHINDTGLDDTAASMVLTGFAGSTLPDLKQIYFTMPEGTEIHVEDILELARAAPNLSHLKLSKELRWETDFSNELKLVGSDDYFLESLAISLPKLQFLDLSSCATKASEKSLVSLGRHCPGLIDCRLTLRLSFQELHTSCQQTSLSWPKLKTLYISNRDLEDFGDESMKPMDNYQVRDMWRVIVQAMPQLENVRFPSKRVRMIVDAIIYGDDDNIYYDPNETFEEGDSDSGETHTIDSDDRNWYNGLD